MRLEHGKKEISELTIEFKFEINGDSMMEILSD